MVLWIQKKKKDCKVMMLGNERTVDVGDYVVAVEGTALVTEG